MNFAQSLQSAPVGAVLISYGDGHMPTGPKGKLLQIAYNGIRKHQRALYPHSSKVDGIHVQIKVSHQGLHGTWVSAEFPTVTLEETPFESHRKYRLYAYVWEFNPPAEQKLRDYAMSMVGKPYDTLQLVGIAASEQKWIPKFMRNWLGERLQLPGRKEVCSTLAHRALLAAWEMDSRVNLPRPLGDRDPFDCCPADFENHSATFHLLAKLNT